jgi:DNA-binding MarR family transcriptional regulator
MIVINDLPLTEKQKQVFNFIVEYKKCNTIAPTQREIAEELGFSHSRASQHLDSLSDKGFIERLRGDRGIKIIRGE